MLVRGRFARVRASMSWRSSSTIVSSFSASAAVCTGPWTTAMAESSSPMQTEQR